MVWVCLILKFIRWPWTPILKAIRWLQIPIIYVSWSLVHSCLIAKIIPHVILNASSIHLIKLITTYGDTCLYLIRMVWHATRLLVFLSWVVLLYKLLVICLICNYSGTYVIDSMFDHTKSSYYFVNLSRISDVLYQQLIWLLLISSNGIFYERSWYQ